jgi:hypothetical protein
MFLLLLRLLFNSLSVSTHVGTACVPTSVRVENVQHVEVHDVEAHSAARDPAMILHTLAARDPARTKFTQYSTQTSILHYARTQTRTVGQSP